MRQGGARDQAVHWIFGERIAEARGLQGNSSSQGEDDEVLFKLSEELAALDEELKLFTCVFLSDLPKRDAGDGQGFASCLCFADAGACLDGELFRRQFGPQGAVGVEKNHLRRFFRSRGQGSAAMRSHSCSENSDETTSPRMVPSRLRRPRIDFVS